MNKRIFKKVNKYGRCLCLADRITVIPRGYLAGYFRNFPSDYRLVRKILKRKGRMWHLAKLKADVRTDYRHPGYDPVTRDDYFGKIHYGMYCQYLTIEEGKRSFFRIPKIQSNVRGKDVAFGI